MHASKPTEVTHEYAIPICDCLLLLPIAIAYCYRPLHCYRLFLLPIASMLLCSVMPVAIIVAIANCNCLLLLYNTVACYFCLLLLLIAIAYCYCLFRLLVAIA